MPRTANSTLKSQNEIATFPNHEADLLPMGTSITTSLLSSNWAGLCIHAGERGIPSEAVVCEGEALELII